MNSLFRHSIDYINYSWEYFIVMGFFILAGIFLIRYTSKWSYSKQKKLLIVCSIVISLLQLIKIPLNFWLDKYDKLTDLPFHLCNFLPFIMIFVFIFNSKKSWSIVFFWILLGTSQAIFTPVVVESLFYFDAIRYWANHYGLVILAIYPMINWKWNINQRDIWYSLLWLNIAALVLYVINILIGDCNYMYVMHRPPGANLFRLLPPWPYYLLVIEVIFIIWGYLLLLLFGRKPLIE